MLTWKKLSDTAYRARLPVYGHVRVETCGDGKWEVNASAPGICDTLLPRSFKSADDAKSGAGEFVTEACKAFLSAAETQ